MGDSLQYLHSDEAEGVITVSRDPPPQGPRFNLEELRPWEVHFCDNKQFANGKQALVVVDHKSRKSRVQDQKEGASDEQTVFQVGATPDESFPMQMDEDAAPSAGQVRILTV